MALGCKAQALFSSTGMTVMLNAIPYYVPASPVATFSIALGKVNNAVAVAGLVPLTVFETA